MFVWALVELVALAVPAAHMFVWTLVDQPGQVLDIPVQVLDIPVQVLDIPVQVLDIPVQLPLPVALAWMHMRNFVLLQDLNNWLCRRQAIQTQAV